MEKRQSKRSLRVALVLGTAVAGTALVGWGGLAAWNAYTENAGNSVAAGTLQHNNYVSSNCASVIGVAPVGAGPGWCSAMMTISGADPVNGVLPATGVVKIDNTGTLQSTFSMSMPSAPSGSLCADLTLKVTSLSAGVPRHAVRGHRPEHDHGRDRRGQRRWRPEHQLVAQRRRGHGHRRDR